MVESTIFIGAIIIAVTQAVRLLVPKVNGAVTILVAILVGILVALVDKEIGVFDVTVAQGIMIALASVGTVTTVEKIG